jgi:hypothetical protein
MYYLRSKAAADAIKFTVDHDVLDKEREILDKFANEECVKRKRSRPKDLFEDKETVTSEKYAKQVVSAN